jgi:hypothetical protein
MAREEGTCIRTTCFRKPSRVPSTAPATAPGMWTQPELHAVPLIGDDDTLTFDPPDCRPTAEEQIVGRGGRRANQAGHPLPLRG